MLKGVSLFSSAGIGELRLPDGIEIVVANEIIKQRADCYSFFYPNAHMICGDIAEDAVKESVIEIANKEHCNLLIATPPCQGLSTLGKNKIQKHYENDRRNFLVLEAFEVIDRCDFDYVLIENVPKFIDMYFPYEGQYLRLAEIMDKRYSKRFNVEVQVLNAKDYGIAQSRPRAIIKMYKKDKSWPWPEKQEEITLFEAIGHLPSLEPGEKSDIKWHSAKMVRSGIADALRHTEPGHSAIANEIYYPKKKDGTRIKGFHNTYKRMVWDQPCPARTTYSGSVSSHNNVHPGRIQNDGTYSDPRVLSLLETFIVSSIPTDIAFPPGSTETFIRTVIGEAIPPLLMKEIIQGVN